jgi:hypothetical protein
VGVGDKLLFMLASSDNSSSRGTESVRPGEALFRLLRRLRCLFLWHEAAVDDSLRYVIPEASYVAWWWEGKPAVTVDVQKRTIWVGPTVCKFCGCHLVVRGCSLSVTEISRQEFLARTEERAHLQRAEGSAKP